MNLNNTKHYHRKMFNSRSVTKWHNTPRSCWTEEEVQMISHDQLSLLQKFGGDLTLKPSDFTKYGLKNIITYCHCATFWRIRCFSVVCLCTCPLTLLPHGWVKYHETSPRRPPAIPPISDLLWGSSLNRRWMCRNLGSIVQ